MLHIFLKIWTPVVSHAIRIFYFYEKKNMFVLTKGSCSSVTQFTSVSYCMVCASVQEDNPGALASGLSPVQMHKPYNNVLTAPSCICNLYVASYLV